LAGEENSCRANNYADKQQQRVHFHCPFDLQLEKVVLADISQLSYRLDAVDQCLLLGVKETSRFGTAMSAFDPKHSKCSPASKSTLWA
jgi:hypothetical protein